MLAANAYCAVREPAFAGSFYPADSAELAALVNSHLSAVNSISDIEGELIALIVPHAGLMYSGKIAAHSYKLLEGQNIDNVILCGPSHRYRFDGLSVYGPFINWKIPLGEVASNTKLCEQMINFDKNIEMFRQAQLQEHCLEVQLPYLKTVLPNAKIVPVVMGLPKPETIDLLAEVLMDIDDNPGTVMIASTDWQHYRPADIGYAMDSLGLDCVLNLDYITLQAYLTSGQVEMCGGGPVVSVLKAAVERGADQAVLLKYGDSGDESGDRASVVGYAAVAIYKSIEENPDLSAVEEVRLTPLEGKKLPDPFVLNASQKKELLNIARKTLESYLADGTIPEFEASDNLKKFGAAFVTLTRNGELRGCIGQTTATEPLHLNISRHAVDAAVSDPRFTPVTRAELDSLKIEISVLSPIQPVESLNEIEIGRDGLMIFKGSSRGLLLPQVATDYKWDLNTFLEQTCHKAGLPANAYKDPDVTIFRFQAVVFGE